jgi:hypothetical protein
MINLWAHLTFILRLFWLGADLTEDDLTWGRFDWKSYIYILKISSHTCAVCLNIDYCLILVDSTVSWVSEHSRILFFNSIGLRLANRMTSKTQSSRNPYPFPKVQNDGDFFGSRYTEVIFIIKLLVLKIIFFVNNITSGKFRLSQCARTATVVEQYWYSVAIFDTLYMRIWS